MATKDNFFQTSDGLWLYYEMHGSGKPILLLPGFGESLKMWRHSVPVLSEGHQVICLDLRGHGRSMKVPGGNRQVRMAQDVRELIDHLGLQDVLLVGHSLGGAVAATYANTQEEHALRGLIPVSYTHLDVYKRQAPSRFQVQIPHPLPESRRDGRCAVVPGPHPLSGRG